MGWLANRGLIVAANVHDDDGMRPTEEMYQSFAKALGLPSNSTQTIPFSCVNSTYLYNLEDVVLKDVENVCLISRIRLILSSTNARSIVNDIHSLSCRWE